MLGLVIESTIKLVAHLDESLAEVDLTVSLRRIRHADWRVVAACEDERLRMLLAGREALI
jgi:hypothetical protein